jgi:MFS family permease
LPHVLNFPTALSLHSASVVEQVHKNKVRDAKLSQMTKFRRFRQPGNMIRAARHLPERSVFFNLGVFQFLTFLRRGVFYTFMIPYLFKLMQTVTSTTTLGTFNMMASALGQNLLWGRICDRYKIRAGLIVIGETIAAFAYIIVYLVHHSMISIGNTFSAGLTIIFGLSVLEFFWSMSDVGWAALLTDITTSEKRGRIVGILNFIASAGRMTGIFFAGFLYDNGEGFKNGTIFYTVTIMLLSGAALMTFTSRRVTARKNLPEKPCTGIIEEHNGEPEREKVNVYKWFLVSLVIVVLGAASVNQVFLLFIQLGEDLNASDPQMAVILAAWTLGGMISLAAGRLSDRIGRVKVILLGLGLAILTPLLYGSASTVQMMALIYGLNGVAFWTVQTVGFVFAGDLIPEHKRARLLSIYNTVMALSWGPAGLLIGGPLADIQVKNYGLAAHAAYTNLFYIASTILTFGTVLFILKVARFTSRSNAQLLNRTPHKQDKMTHDARV